MRWLIGLGNRELVREAKGRQGMKLMFSEHLLWAGPGNAYPTSCYLSDSQYPLSHNSNPDLPNARLQMLPISSHGFLWGEMAGRERTAMKASQRH